jgi:hypothetical protein
MKRRNTQKGLNTNNTGGVVRRGQGNSKDHKPVRYSTLTQEGPKPRDGHVSAMLDNNMFVFGGDRHQVPFNDLYFLPVEKI